MYRELYGALKDCEAYVEDKNHKTFAWMEYPFSLIFENKTKYLLKIWKRKEFGADLIELAPKQKVKVVFNDWSEQSLKVESDDALLRCYFKIQSGIMVERRWIEKKKEIKEYLVPVFHMGKIELVVYNTPEPNMGKIYQYKLEPLKAGKIDTMKVLVKNCSVYDVLFSIEKGIFANIKSGEKKEIIFPRNGTVYIDTELEEILYENPYFSYNSVERKILKVNGCCLEIEHGKVTKKHAIYGPALAEPYIRCLYISEEEGEGKEQTTEIRIWCWTIDDRLE